MSKPRKPRGYSTEPIEKVLGIRPEDLQAMVEPIKDDGGWDNMKTTEFYDFGRGRRLECALSYARGLAAATDQDDDLWAALASLAECRGMLLATWVRRPDPWMIRCVEWAWGDDVVGDAAGTGSEEVVVYHDWPGKNASSQRQALERPDPETGLYTLDQLRKAWGAGAWAARRGRA